MLKVRAYFTGAASSTFTILGFMDHEKIFKEQIDTPATTFSIKLQGLSAAPERFQEKSSCGMRVGPQEHLDITDNMFKFGVQKGLRGAFWGPKTRV